MKNTIRAIGVVVFLISFLVGSVVYGMGDNWQTRATLQGFESVQVLVKELNRDAKKMGLTEAELKTDIESKLKNEGIRVLGEMGREHGNPILYLVIKSVKATSRGGSAFHIDLSFWQDVRIARSGESTRAPTWSISGIGVTQKKKVIENSVEDFADRFISAWLAVNPRQ
jgi:hypothetical protein